MPETHSNIAVEIPWRTIFKVLAAIALVWLWLTVVELVLVLIVAVLLAVTLDPVVAWFERHGLSRGLATAAVGGIVLLTIGGFLWLTWASLADQARYLTQYLSEFEGDVFAKLPDWMRNAIGTQSGEEIKSNVAGYAMRLGQSVAAAITVSLLAFILTMYLLVEGKETHDWFLAFVPRRHRVKAQRTMTECERVIFAYVAGNVLLSIIATIVTFTALSLLKVPAAFLLALMAGLSDFVPVVGFIVSSIPAIVLALTVSPATALVVVAVYVAYNTVETYFLSPWAYGDRLKLSNVAIIVAFVIGAQIAGVIGAVIALPVAAIYPYIEEIWLREQLPPETVADHKAIEQKSA